MLSISEFWLEYSQNATRDRFRPGSCRGFEKPQGKPPRRCARLYRRASSPPTDEDEQEQNQRLRGLSHPEYRLRIDDDIRVYYDVVEDEVQVLAIIPKSEADDWLAEHGEADETDSAV
jgi:hypothetical protein